MNAPDNIINLPLPARSECFTVMVVGDTLHPSGIGVAHILVSHRSGRTFRVYRAPGWEAGEDVFVPYRRGGGPFALDWSHYTATYESNSDEL